MYKILIIPAERFPSRHPFLEEIYTRDQRYFRACFLMQCKYIKKVTTAKWNQSKAYLFPAVSPFVIYNKIKNYFFDFRYIWHIIYIFKKEQIDIIQVRDVTFPLCIALMLKLLTNVKVIYQKSHPHEIRKLQDGSKRKCPILMYYIRRIENFILHKSLAFCDAVFPISKHMALTLHRDYYIPLNKLFPFGMGVNVNIFSNIVSQEKKTQNFDLIRMAYIGTLGEKRELEYLLESIHILLKRVDKKKIMLSVIGGTPDEINFLKKIAHNLSLENIVQFYGYIDRDIVYDLIKDHHIGISYIPNKKSYIDSSPTKLFEFLGLGLPVIATSCVIEQKNIIEKTGAGLLTDVNADDVAEKIYILIKNIDFYTKKARLARSYIYENYSYQKMCSDIAAVYDEIF